MRIEAKSAGKPLTEIIRAWLDRSEPKPEACPGGALGDDAGEA